MSKTVTIKELELGKYKINYMGEIVIVELKETEYLKDGKAFFLEDEYIPEVLIDAIEPKRL